MHGSAITYATDGVLSGRWMVRRSAPGRARRRAPRRFAQGRPVGELHTWPSGRRRLAGGGLDRVDRPPAVPADRLRGVRGDERVDVVCDRPVDVAGGDVLEDPVDGVLGVLLV